MLVLSRKLNESIQIGNYLVKVTAIQGSYVRLGITAPREVKILREELEHRDIARKDPGELKREAAGKSLHAKQPGGTDA